MGDLNERRTISRRELLGVAKDTAILAGVFLGGVAVDRFLLQGKDHFQAPNIPEDKVDEFRVGQTTFGFSDGWTKTEREDISDTIVNYYWPVANYFGSEFIDYTNSPGVNCLIQYQTSLPEGEVGEAQVVIGTNNVVLNLVPNTPEFKFTIVHEMGHLCWGAVTIGEERERYQILHEGFPNAVASIVMKDESLKARKNQSGIKIFDFNIADKPNIAFYGNKANGLQPARILLGAQALIDALRDDSDLLKRFHRGYIDRFSEKRSTVTISEIRKLFEETYKGNFEALQEKHRILGSAVSGKNLVIAPSVSGDLGEEIIAALCFDRDESGFTEIPIVGTNIKREVFTQGGEVILNDNTVTTDSGARALLQASQLSKYSGELITLRATTDFGQAEVQIAA